MTTDCILEVKNLFSYHNILSNINFGISKGEYFVILGPTGSGKTYLVETILGKNSPLKGNIYLDQKDITHFPPEKRNIGYVPQDYVLFPHLQVKENILFPLQFCKNNNKALHFDELTQFLKISHILSRFPLSLSGGEKQRVALARALMINPLILILDEPTSSLDSLIKMKVQVVLRNLKEHFKITVLHITHDLNEALFLADKILILNEGHIEQVGETQELFLNPKNDFIKNFLGLTSRFFMKKD